MSTKLVLCNGNLSLVQLNQILESFPSPKIVCTTHALFEREIKSLSEVARKGTVFYVLADFFSDDELWGVDASALERAKQKQPSAGKGGFECFRTEMIEIRSEILYKKLQHKFGELEPWVVDGLGISAAWWVQHGGKQITVEADHRHFQNSSSLPRRLLERLNKSSHWTEMLFQNQAVVLFSRLSRVLNKVNAEYKPVPLWKRLVVVVSRMNIFPFSSHFLPACTLHEMVRVGRRPMLIFQDGHFPSNYSGGLLWEYESHHTFVPSNPFAEKWLMNCGRQTLKLHGFCDPLMQKAIVQSEKIQNVLFALNHAGDWSALINRSDTCLLVQAVKSLAVSAQHLCIRIRPHPTMSHPSHEGADSYHRIVDEVNSWDIDSVRISSESMEADLAWADVVVSEYSQVLIDAWYSGKLGLIFNPTHRRSFMSDYENMGFMAVGTVDALSVALTEKSEVIRQKQNEAVEQFNVVVSETML